MTVVMHILELVNRFLTLLFVIFLYSCGGAEVNDGDNARVMMWQFVKDNLKDPGSADFGLCKMIETADKGWEADCYVDAKNWFGGTERVYFYCKVKHLNGTEWALEELIFK